MASSYIAQKGRCQQHMQNAKLTSKLVLLDSSESQMIYSLLIAYTGCLAPRDHSSSQSHLKLSTVHPFRTPPSLRAFTLLLPSVPRQSFHMNLESWRKEHLYQTSYGSIQVSQFSFFGITISKRSSRLSQYCCALFYIQKGLNWWHVDFVITLNLKGSWKVRQCRTHTLYKWLCLDINSCLFPLYRLSKITNPG